jgi:hypothetical protein
MAIKLACASKAIFLVALSIRSRKLLIGMEVSFGSPQGVWVKSWVRSWGGGGVWLSEPVLWLLFSIGRAVVPLKTKQDRKELTIYYLYIYIYRSQHISSTPRTGLYSHIITAVCCYHWLFDMDMSNGWRINKIRRVRSDAHSHSHKWRHAAAAMRANNVLRNNYNTRPLLCAPITCYVTVITHGHCYACA